MASNTRGLWLAIIVTAGFVVGIAGGILAWLGGAHPALAVLAGAGGFVTFVTLSLTVANFLKSSEA
ncbi:hypothetical protein AB0C10_15740 [Microbispora amethystogenes]|uniref:hypothetical protein n=1 Tax=Microbispora amethystogenes TaxID=1427754 RepID=UPI0033E66606